MDNNSIPKKDEGFLCEEFETEILLYHPSNNKSFYLNQQAALIWELCDGENSVGNIIEILQEAFPDAAEQIETDVKKSIDTFVENKAITLS